MLKRTNLLNIIILTVGICLMDAHLFMAKGETSAAMLAFLWLMTAVCSISNSALCAIFVAEKQKAAEAKIVEVMKRK